MPIVIDLETQSMPPYPDGFARMAVACTFDVFDQRFKVFRETDIDKLAFVLEQTDKILGYNIKRFDIGLVLKNYFPTSELQKKTIDLISYFRTVKESATLDNLAQTNLGKSKVHLDVSIPVAWQQGREDDVIRRCIVDVRLTYELYQLAATQGFLSYEYRGSIKEVPITFPDDLFL